MLRKFDDKANMQLIMMAVIAAVLLVVSLVVIFSVLGGIDYEGLDTDYKTGLGLQAVNDNDADNATWNATRPAGNASDTLVANVETFYTISPIYLVVLAAVGIISAIMMIMIRRE